MFILQNWLYQQFEIRMTSHCCNLKTQMEVSSHKEVSGIQHLKAKSVFRCVSESLEYCLMIPDKL